MEEVRYQMATQSIDAGLEFFVVEKGALLWKPAFSIAVRTYLFAYQFTQELFETERVKSKTVSSPAKINA